MGQVIAVLIIVQIIELALILRLFAAKCNHRMVDVEPYHVDRGGKSVCEVCDKVKVYAPLPR